METLESLQARIAELEAKNKRQAERLASRQKLSLKIAEKGGVSLYGLGRFPQSLYYSQWVALLNFFGCPLDNPNRMQIEEWKDEGKLTLKD